MWKLVQSAIILGVVYLNMIFQITPNSNIPAVFGFLCAAGLTYFCNWFGTGAVA